METATNTGLAVLILIGLFIVHAAERALAHTVKNTVEAAYHRTDLLEQRRVMMLQWERHCLNG